MVEVRADKLTESTRTLLQDKGVTHLSEGGWENLLFLDGFKTLRMQGDTFEVFDGGKLYIMGKTFVLQPSFTLARTMTPFAYSESEKIKKLTAQLRGFVAKKLVGNRVEVRVPYLYDKINELVSSPRLQHTKFSDYDGYVVSDGLHLSLGATGSYVRQGLYNFRENVNDSFDREHSKAGWGYEIFREPAIADLTLRALVRSFVEIGDINSDVGFGTLTHADMREFVQRWEDISSITSRIELGVYERMQSYAPWLLSHFTTFWVEESHYAYYHRSQELI